jgi:hypothetical protein
MALKNQDPKGAGNGKGKMTVVMFQVEGSDESLREAIRAMEHGFEKMAPSAPIYKMIQAPVKTEAHGALPIGGEDEAIAPEMLEAERSAYEDAASSRSENSTSEKKKRYPPKAIAAVKGIDWDSKTSWRDYVAQKKPESHSSRFISVAGWFKYFRNLDVITPGHIVAAFDVMDWPKPENIPNTFAQFKHKKAGELFDKGEKANEWVLSQRGINALDRLGKEKGK